MLHPPLHRKVAVPNGHPALLDYMATTHYLARKLQCYVELDDADRLMLEAACGRPQHLMPGTEVTMAGTRPTGMRLVVEGFAIQHRATRSGSRQITNVLLPGDLCSPHAFLLDSFDYGVSTLTAATVAEIPAEAAIRLLAERPRLALGFQVSALVCESILREWLVNVGQRDAYERTAHFLSEIHARLDAVGMCEQGTCRLPFTQDEIGDVLGLSNVHVNRMLQRLRQENLITLNRSTLTVHDLRRLHDTAGFSPGYLHLRRVQERVREAAAG